MLDELGITAKKLVMGIVALVAIVLAFGSVYVNSEYERAVVTNLGEIDRVTGPGLHFKIPFIETTHIADIRLSKFDYPNTETATRDGQAIGVSITLNHRIEDSTPAIERLYKQFGSNFDYEERMLRHLAIDRIKGVIGQYSMEDFMPNREKIRLEAKNAVIAAAGEYGILIEDLQLADIQFSQRFRARLEEVAEQRAEAAKAQQMARKEEYLAMQKVEKAKGDAEQRKLLADAEAHAITVESVAKADAVQREGEAKAAALKAQAEVLKHSEGLVELTRAEALKQWDGSSTPQIVITGQGGTGGSLIPFLNVGEMLNKK